MYSVDLGVTRLVQEAMIPDRRIAIFAPSMAYGREVFEEIRKQSLPIWEPSKRKLTWRSGSTAQFFTAQETDSWRGTQFHFGWAVGVCSWVTRESLDSTIFMAQMVVRLPPAQFLVTY